MLDFIFERYRGFKGFIRDTVDRVHEINQKYSKPRVKMSRMVEISLLFLRVYLLILVLMLVYKFYTIVKG